MFSHISLFSDFFQRQSFSLTQSEIPWLFPDLEEIFHPDLSWLVATMQDLLPVSKLVTVKLWNNLEPFLKLSQSVKNFKRSLRSQLLDHFVNTS